MKLKTLWIFIALLTSQLALANTKHDKWVCEIRDPNWPGPKKSEVFISLEKPVVTWVDYFLDEQGKLAADPEELITATTVSRYKADRTKCVIKSGFRQGEFVDDYEFDFACAGIEGRFSMDFRDSTGFYLERLTSMGTQKSFSFENCKETN